MPWWQTWDDNKHVIINQVKKLYGPVDTDISITIFIFEPAEDKTMGWWTNTH